MEQALQLRVPVAPAILLYHVAISCWISLKEFCQHTDICFDYITMIRDLPY